MRKKILFIITALNGGGAERVLINILRYLDYNLYDVDLCLLFQEGVFLPDVDKRVKVYSVYSAKSLLYKLHRKFYQYIGSVFFLSGRIRKTICQNYDTIVSFAEGTSLQFHQFILDKGNRHVTWVHTDFINNHWTGHLYKRGDEEIAYKNMHEIVFVSKDAQLQFNHCFPTINVQQRVIYNLIDTELIRKEAEREKPKKRKFTIVAVGRLVEAKRFDRLINVCGMLKQNHYDVDTWIIGEGHLRNELEDQIKELHLQDNVFLLGFKNPPYAYMREADLFVSTSDVEGYPLVVCEAMTLGLPIVATKITGPMELLENNRYGLLVEKKEEDILGAILQMLKDETKYKFYKGQSFMKSTEFKVDAVLEEIYSVI